LKSLLEQTAALARRRAQRQGIPLTYISPRREVRLLADATQLRQLVLNLLMNAIDATPRGGCVRLECRVENLAPTFPANASRTRREPPWVAIIVRDDGMGLPAELGERIFAPFVTTKETGTGLGLSICKQIVEAHGGRIKAENREGGGAVFEVRLPLVQADEPDDAEEPERIRQNVSEGVEV